MALGLVNVTKDVLFPSRFNVSFSLFTHCACLIDLSVFTIFIFSLKLYIWGWSVVIVFSASHCVSRGRLFKGSDTHGEGLLGLVS
jgi:hypothetical protein